MSSAKDRRLVVAAFAKRAVAETPLTSVTTVPGGPAPAVAGKKPIGKGKKISAVPQIHTAACESLVGGLSAHLEKLGAGSAPPKSHGVPSSIIEMLDKASKCSAKTKKKSKHNPGYHKKGAAEKDTGDKSKQQPTKPGIVDLSSASDTAPKKADEKKPEPKESENEVKKAAIDLPGMAPPPGQPPTPGAPGMPQPDAQASGGGINIDEILKSLGGGLETIGSKSMSGVGSVLGGLGMPGAEEQLGMWSKDPAVSKGVGGGVSALGAILMAYLIKRLMAGGGDEGMLQSAGLRCQDLVKKAQPQLGAGGASAIAPAPTPAPTPTPTPVPAQISGAAPVNAKATAQGVARAQEAIKPTPTPAAPVQAPPAGNPQQRQWIRSMFG